jgi:hypothetical protein
VYIIFSNMTKENEITKTLIGTSAPQNFAFRFVGTILSHDKRIFEQLHQLLNTTMMCTLDHPHWNESEERTDFAFYLDLLDDLASITRSMYNKKLEKEFENILLQLEFKHRQQEVNNG